MKQTFLLSFLLLLHTYCSHAQGIIGPDTVTANTPADFYSPVSGSSFTWSTNLQDVAPVASNYRTFSFSSLSSPTIQSLMLKENGNYTGFLMTGSSDLFRLDYGTSAQNSPVVTLVGNYGFGIDNVQGLDMIKENGSWYGLMTNGGSLIRLDFGNSLINTPTVTFMDFSADIWYAMQITIKRISDTSVIAFAGHFGLDRLLRFDFGSSITHTPALTMIGTGGDFESPCYFALFEQANQWSMLVTNLLGDRISRVDFGTDLRNDTPSITNLGNTGNLLALPRAAVFITGCNDLFALVANEDGSMVKLDFNNNIYSTPTASPFTIFSAPANTSGVGPFWDNDKLSLMVADFGQPLVHLLDVQQVPASSPVKYYDSSLHYTFPDTGIHSITLQVDQGSPSAPATYCKQIFVREMINNVEALSAAAFTCSPNPSPGMFHFSLNQLNGKTAMVKCTGITGQLVYKRTVPVVNGRMEYLLDIEAVPDGIYILQVICEDKTVTKKLLKSHR